MPCCEVLDFSLNGSRMFTGVSRMECKALATQLALMRWQLRQQTWAVRRPNEARALGRAIGGMHAKSSSRGGSSASNPDQDPSSGLQQEMNITQQDQTQSLRATAEEGTAASSRQEWQSGSQPRPVKQLPASSSRRAAGTVQWVQAAAAPVARRPVPSLAQLRAERVRDQRMRDALKGSILRGCGCLAEKVSGILPRLRTDT